MQLIPDNTFPISWRKAVARARRLFRQELQELQNPVHSARNLAAAFALGTLLSFIPIPVLDSMLVGLVLVRFKQVNRAPLFMARLLWNDLLVFPLYGPGYRLGSALLVPLMSAGPDTPGVGTAVAPLLSFTLGGMLVAAGFAAAGFVVFYLGISLYRVGRVVVGE